MFAEIRMSSCRGHRRVPASLEPTASQLATSCRSVSIRANGGIASCVMVTWWTLDMRSILPSISVDGNGGMLLSQSPAGLPTKAHLGAARGKRLCLRPYRVDTQSAFYSTPMRRSSDVSESGGISATTLCNIVQTRNSSARFAYPTPMPRTSLVELRPMRRNGAKVPPRLRVPCPIFGLVTDGDSRPIQTVVS